MGPRGAAPPNGRPPDPRASDPRLLEARSQAFSQQRRHKRNVGVLVGLLVLIVGVAAGVAVVRGWLPGDTAKPVVGAGLAAGLGSVQPGASGSGSPAPSAAPSPGGSTQPAANVPDKGAGTFAFATGTGAVLGSAGNVRRYRVAVENGAGVDVKAFAAQVDSILGDAKGWTAGGTVRLQRVPQNSANEVTIYLATPATTDAICVTGGLHVQKFLSCRLPGQIVINLARWLTAVPDYGAPLASYQQFALNHEVGRDLGYPNQACPGAGQPAPVMEQQSLGLDGCVANPWPYLSGSLYQGRPLP